MFSYNLCFLSLNLLRSRKYWNSRYDEKTVSLYHWQIWMTNQNLSSYSNRNTISKHVRLLWIFFLNWSGNVFYNNKRGSVLWRRWCLAILGILDLQIHLNRLFSPTNLSNAMFLLRVSWTCSSRKQCQQTRLFGFFVHCFVLSSNA